MVKLYDWLIYLAKRRPHLINYEGPIMRNSILIISVLILTMVTAIRAEDNPGIVDELAQRPFYIDYSAFADTVPNSMILEVYYKIFSSSLSYHKWGDKFKADYTANIAISQKGKQVTGASNDGSLIADNYRASLSKNDFIINLDIFHLTPGNYHLMATLIDPNGAEQLTHPIELNIKLKDFGKKANGLSTIEFLRAATPANGDSEFVKDGMMMIPSVSRLYGDTEPELVFYYEIYNNNPEFAGDYLVTYTIGDRDNVIMADTSLFPANGATTTRLERIKVDTLLPGEYNLALTVKSPGHKFKAGLNDDFRIGWSVMALVKNDFNTAVEQLRYVATSAERKKLRESPAKDHIKLWNEFWKSKDPTPSTPDNELKDEYYKRIRYSDLNFGHFGRDGWKTDMGMVYVTYGPPDEIERHPFDIDAKAFQIWYYYGLKRTFRFVDFNGYGEYELIFPYDGDLRKLH
jgi:GWxTD domain-containing protein